MANNTQFLLFDVLKNVLQEKSEVTFQKHIEVEGFEKSFPRYMLIRYLSMHPNKEVSSIIIDNQTSLERFPSNKLFYKFLLANIPQQKSAWIKYLK